MKENCLSGGRYCALPARDHLKGERVLVQDLYHICTEQHCKKEKLLTKWTEYLYQFDQVCAHKMEIKCTQQLLKKLDIKEKVEECVNTSVEMVGTKRRLFLNDNTLLRDQKKKFSAVQHFNKFPLLKINETVYYGPIDTVNVMSFICRHVRDDLVGCEEYIKKIQAKKGHGFTIFVIIVVGALFLWLFNRCRISLRARFENEMNLQVDASINKFLAKTGGNAL